MGSVKDLEVIEDPTNHGLGKGIFTFSDRYSIFDWEKMPDLIPNKGKALCMMAAWNFERLEEEGIETHYLGVLNDNNGKIVKTSDLSEPSNRMMVNLSRVIEPSFFNGVYHYTSFIENRGKINNFVVPLEVIYRRGAPKGSSLFKKIDELKEKKDEEGLKNLLVQYGLTKKPNHGDLFPRIGYDFTTKFESSDRKLTKEEAYEISGLTRMQFEELQAMRGSVVYFISERAKEVGFTDYDGKHEYLFFQGIKLADVVGTFDENRFMFNGEQVSKEVLRQYHKTHQTEWVEDIERAKSNAENNRISDWKSLVTIQPQNLDPVLINLVGEMYAAGSDLYTGLNLFRVRPLEQVMEDLRAYK